MKPNPPNPETLFTAALEIREATARAAYLDQSCGDQSSLREEVESLLAAHAQAGDFLQTPAHVAGQATPAPGTAVRHLGDYELLEEIARGGMGVVFKARQLSLNRIVAVKMILAGQLASESEVKRFQSEAEAVGSLNHPHIVGIYEVGEHEGHHYFSMPLVAGATLAELVVSGRWKSADGRAAARLLAKIARAINYAHQAGILHRDLKPGNILIKPDGEPCVADFGLAKRGELDRSLTLSGHMLGTPSFMAPEQASGKRQRWTTATDIYGLGAVLYYLLTGRPPFVADSPLDALLLVLEGEAVMPRTLNPRTPPDLQRICMRCLEKSPENRYPSALALAEDLERFLKGEPLQSVPGRMPHRFMAWMQRRPALVFRLASMALCSAISQVGFHFQQHMSTSDHAKVQVVLALWAAVSVVCQFALQKERWANPVRFLWSAADVVSLTAILFLAQAVNGPLLALYPTLVAASGLWLRVPLVLFATALSAAGAGLLLLGAPPRVASVVLPHWHLIVLVGLALTGFSVAYLVHRVRVLNAFYEHRPLP